MKLDFLPLFLFTTSTKQCNFPTSSSTTTATTLLSELNTQTQLCEHQHHKHAGVSRHSRRDVISSLPTSLIFISSLLVNKPEKCQAIESSEAEISYDKYAKTYDDLDGGSIADKLGIVQARSNLIGQARGKVLEVAVGTGLNLSKYKFASSPSAMDGVTSLTLLDISDGMLSEAKAKFDGMEKAGIVPSFVNVEFIKADATASDVTTMFGENAFDTVVDTFSLCVMGNEGAKRCLQQMRNVVKKQSDGGQILLIENSRSSNSFLGWYQDITAEAAASAGGKGCVSNQNVKSFIENIDGLQLEKEEEFASGFFRSFVCTKM